MSKIRRNKALLSQSERDRIFAMVRRRFEAAIMAVEKELQKYLEPQVEQRVAERQKGIRKSSLKVPAKLFKKHKRLIFGLMMETDRQAIAIAKDNISRFKKQNKKALYRNAKIKELDASYVGLQEAYNRKAAGYKKNSNKLIDEMAADISKARFASTLKLAKDVMANSVKQGLTRTETREKLQQSFTKYNTYQLDRVVTTEQTRMIAVSEFPEYQADDLIIGYVWQVNYVGCPICDAKAAMGVVPKDEVAKLGLPPAHPNCLHGDTLILPVGDITAISKRLYNGNMIIFETTTGFKLTCTPNHPILTDKGFVAANTLDINSKVVCDSISQRERFIDNKSINRPATIEKIADTFFKKSNFRLCKVPITPKDFHCDGVGSKIAIIATDSLLRNSFDIPFCEHIFKNNFIIRNIARVFFNSLSMFAFSFKRNRLSNAYFISRFRLFLSFLKRHFTISHKTGRASISDGDIGVNQPASDSGSANIKSVGDSLFRNPAYIELANSLLAEVGGRFSFDNVVHISTFHFTGYVYNLETTESYYIANGIASHNCECTLEPVFADPLDILKK